MNRNEVLTRISNAVAEVEPAATTLLYGSTARGDWREDSDIDLLILVDVDKLTHQRSRLITNRLSDIEWETGIPISPMVITRQSWMSRPFATPFQLNVQHEAIPL